MKWHSSEKLIIAQLVKKGSLLFMSPEGSLPCSHSLTTQPCCQQIHPNECDKLFIAWLWHWKVSRHLLQITIIFSFSLCFICQPILCSRYVLAKMEEDSEDDPHGHITSLAVKRSHR